MTSTMTKRWTVIGICIIIATLPLLFCVAPMIWGWSSYLVTTGSMGKAIPAGSVIVTRPVQPQDVVADAIILFRYKEANVLHYVTAVIESEDPAAKRTVYTQGYANDRGDPIKVHDEDIRGIYVYHLPYLGYPVQWIQGNKWLLVLLIVFGWFWLKKRDSKQQVMTCSEK